MSRILNFGSLNLDYVYSVDHFVRPGETLNADSQTVNAGGKGLNQSCALARAGASVFHAGCIGHGGESLIGVLKADGVNTDFVLKVDAFQGNAIIQVDKSGENSILLFGGSNQCIMEQQILDTLSSFGKGDYLLVQNEVNHLSLIVSKAYEQGMTIILNPSPFDDRLNDVDLGKVSWLLLNEVEAEQLSGSREPNTAWQHIHQKYPNLSAVITLGKQGSFAFRVENSAVETASQRAVTVEALDTTAAGDTYTGYFVTALMEGKPLQDCMRLASMASAIGVTRAGAAPSIPYRDEVEKELLREEQR